MRLADLYDFDPNGGKQSLNARFMCPFDCAKSSKPVKAANRDLSVNKRTGEYHCFACPAKGILDDFKTETPKQSRKEYVRAKIKRAFAPVPQARPNEDSPDSGDWKSRLVELCQINSDAGAAGANYLEGRDISVEVARASVVRFGRYAHKGEEFAAVVFGMKDTCGKSVGFNARAIVGKLNRHGGNIGAGVFSAKCLDYVAIEGVVIITEAPIDALSLATCGYPAFALGGTPYRDLLGVVDYRATVWLGFDADTAGNEAGEKWAAELKRFGQASRRLSPPDGFKDWNEALTVMGREALRDYLKERIGVAPPMAGEIKAPDPCADNAELVASPTGYPDAPLVPEHAGTVPKYSLAPGEPIPPYNIIASRVLGEEFVLARDDANIELDGQGFFEGRVVYRDSEMRRLKAQNPDVEHLRTVHAVKSLGGGWEIAEATTQEISPEHWEILEGLRFNGGECAARLLVALCRLSDGLREVESRLREVETLGLWERTERTDALGFSIWALTLRDTDRRDVSKHGQTYTEPKTIAPIMERMRFHADGSMVKK